MLIHNTLILPYPLKEEKGVFTPGYAPKITKKKRYRNTIFPKYFLLYIFFNIFPFKSASFPKFCLSLPSKTIKGEYMSTELMKQQIADYFKTQPVLKAWLFGSFARGEETPESDVDILVEYDKDARISLLTISHMMGELEKSTGRKVDLIEEGCLLPFAVESANRDKQLIYERTN